MHITVERMAPDPLFDEIQEVAQDLVLARFTIHDADPDVHEAQRAIATEVRAMRRLNRTLFKLKMTAAPPSGGPDDVWVVIPMPRVLVEDLGFNLAAEVADEIAEAYVHQMATRPRRRR